MGGSTGEHGRAGHTPHQPYGDMGEELVLRSQEHASCSCPSPIAALRKVAPKPHLGNTVVLTLLAGTRVSHTQSSEHGRAGPTIQQSRGRVCVCEGEIDAPPTSCPSLPIADKRADCPSYQLRHSGPLGSDLEGQSLLLAVLSPLLSSYSELTVSAL